MCGQTGGRLLVTRASRPLLAGPKNIRSPPTPAFTRPFCSVQTHLEGGFGFEVFVFVIVVFATTEHNTFLRVNCRIISQQLSSLLS